MDESQRQDGARGRSDSTGRPPVPDWRRHKPRPSCPRPPSSTFGHCADCQNGRLDLLQREIILSLTVAARSGPRSCSTHPLGSTRATEAGRSPLYVKICASSLRSIRASSSVPREHAGASIEPDSEGFQLSSSSSNSFGGAGPRAGGVSRATNAQPLGITDACARYTTA